MFKQTILVNKSLINKLKRESSSKKLNTAILNAVLFSLQDKEKFREFVKQEAEKYYTSVTYSNELEEAVARKAFRNDLAHLKQELNVSLSKLVELAIKYYLQHADAED